MDWDADYLAFAELFAKVADAYGDASGKADFKLDLEYKKVAPSRLVVKQVRPMSFNTAPDEQDVFLLPETSELCVFQGEYGDVFGNHRLKSRWKLSPDARWLDAQGLAATWLENVELEYLDGASIVKSSGDPTAWPGFSHSSSGVGVTDSWSVGTGSQTRAVELACSVPASVSEAQGVIAVLGDFDMVLTSSWTTPVFSLDWEGKPTTVTQDTARLEPCRGRNGPAPGSTLQERKAQGEGVTVNISFYWPPNPRGDTAGYTAPLETWKEATITGLTASALTITSNYALTYLPGHHNFDEWILIEPRLDPAVTAKQLAELEKKNIRALYLQVSPSPMFVGTVQAIGQDDTIRPL